MFCVFFILLIVELFLVSYENMLDFLFEWKNFFVTAIRVIKQKSGGREALGSGWGEHKNFLSPPMIICLT